MGVSFNFLGKIIDWARKRNRNIYILLNSYKYKMIHKFGLYNKNFQMASVTTQDSVVSKVGTVPATFKILLGPLNWNGKIFKETYVLEIHYKESEQVHKKLLPLDGFGSNLCDYYADKASELAETFCEKKDLMINTHLNSWPEYQALVSRDEIREKATMEKVNNIETQMINYLKKHKSSKRAHILHGIYKQLVPSNKGNFCSGLYANLRNSVPQEKLQGLVKTIANNMNNYSHLQNQATKLRKVYNL